MTSDRERGTNPGMSSASLVRLVAGREISSRLRDRTFLISSAVIVLLVLGAIVFQVVLSSQSGTTTVGVVGDRATLGPALATQGRAIGVDVVVRGLADDAAARRAVDDGDVDGALVTGSGGPPELLVKNSADAPLQAVVQGAVTRVVLTQQLAAAGVSLSAAPQVAIRSLNPGADRSGERIATALIGVALLYSLLALFCQFVAQGVVEEKSSRVVELLLATLRPWQLLAGKVLGLGLLGLAQIVVIAGVGVAGALAFDIVSLPGQLVGTMFTIVAWFVLGYAFYASVFAAVASLVSRQEDLPNVIMPTTILLVAAFVIAIQAASNPASTLATVTSYVPGLSPLVMPVREAAGTVPAWQVAVSVLIMLAAIALVVRLGGRIYAGALLRTGGKTSLREALRSERV
jgi:ABC-2 type transport system permease protein